MAQVPASVGIGEVDERDHLEDQHDVGRGDVGAQRARLLGAAVQLGGELTGLAGKPPERLGRRELAGDSLGECLALPVDDAMQAVRVDVPRAAVVAERGAQVVAVAREAVAGELAQQLAGKKLPPC